MLAKVLVFALLLAAVVASPVDPHEEEEEDLPVYTEKVLPNKPTQVPKFGSKKATTTPRKVPEKLDNRKLESHYNPHTTTLPKAVLKSTKPIHASTRPVRRNHRVPSSPPVGHNEIKPTSTEDYDSPPHSFIAGKGLGVEYAEVETPAPREDPVKKYETQESEPPTKAPSRTARHHASALLKPSVYPSNYEPKKLYHQSHSDLGPAVGNAPLLRYAVAPQRFAPVPAPARAKVIPDYGYAGNSYDESPQPYIFGYELQDEYGSTQSRQEQGDDYGNKRGSYGYTDGHGIYRKVDYIADEHGFRAIIHTNEPGTERQNPADVEMNSEANKY